MGIEGSSVGRLRTNFLLGEDLCGASAVHRRDGTGWLSADSGRGRRELVGVRAGYASEGLVPPLSILRSVCLESILVSHRQLVAKAASGDVLPLDLAGIS
jgi:hypothetical protein